MQSGDDIVERPTGPNPAASRGRVAGVLGEVIGSGRAVALAYVDIDQFHLINLRWGAGVGDRVLAELHRRVAGLIDASRHLLVAGADAFNIVIPDAESADEAETIARRVVNVLRRPVEVEGHSIRLTASAGCVWQSEVTDAGELMELAFLACRTAKRSDRGPVVRYDDMSGYAVTARFEVADGLHRALEDGHLVLHYQPCLDLRDGRIVGVEALVRWQHPEKGLIYPDGFIGVAEESGLIVPIGTWVLQEAVAQAVRWRDELGKSVRVWVNLAAGQLVSANELHKVVEDTLATYGATPDLLGMEVTESSLMQNMDVAVATLRAVRRLGVEIALDDFGTGYSSLAYLRRLPVTALKVDRSFVSGMGASLADAAIVEAVIELAHTLGLAVVAEGVDSEAQVGELLALGAERAQGFFFSRPVPAAHVERLFDDPYCGRIEVESVRGTVDHRADRLPGAGGPRARLLLTALDAISDPVVVTDNRPDLHDNRIVYVNPAFEQQTGFSLGEVLNATPAVLDAVDPANDEAVVALAAATNAHESITVEMRSVRVDGTTFPCEVTYSPVYDGGGVATHWIAIRRDLSIRRELERERETLNRLVQIGTTGVLLVKDGVVTWANESADHLVQREGGVVGLPVAGLLDEAVDVGIFTTDGSKSETLAALRTGVGTIPVFAEVQHLEDLERDIDLHAVMIRDRRDFARRIAMQQLAGDFADRALERHPADALDQADLDVLLARIGVLLDVDCCIIDFIDDETGDFHGVAAWAAAGVVRLDGAHAPADQLTAWRALLDEGNVIVRSSFGDEPAWWTERSNAFGPAWQSQVMVPLRAGGRTVGVLGVGMQVRQVARVWTADEVSFMHAVAETIANLVERHNVLRDLARREAELSSVLTATGDLLLALDADGAISYASAAVASLGRRPEDLVGHPLDALFDEQDVARLMRQLAADGTDEQRNVRMRMRHADRSSRWYDLRIGARRGPKGRGMVLACRDIEDVIADEEAEARRAQLDRFALEVSRAALDLGPTGFLGTLDAIFEDYADLMGIDYVYVDVVDDRLALMRNLAGWGCEGAEGLAELTPYPVNEPSTWLQLLGGLQPIVIDDVEASALGELLVRHKPLGTGRATVLIPFTIAGRLAGVLGMGMVKQARPWSSDEVNTAIIVSGIVAGALERDRVDRELRESEARFRILSEHAADVVSLVDANGRIGYVSPSVRDLLGYDADDLVGQHFEQYLHPDDLKTVTRCFARLDEAAISTEVRLLDATGEWRWVAYTAKAVRGESGQLLEVRGSMRDVSDRRRLEEELARRATQDVLTGLSNRTALQQHFERPLADGDVAVLLVDLDGFKEVNDRHGHDVGDAVLQLVARRLEGAVRRGDLLVRYGGDEFVALCPGINADAARRLGERIVRVVAEPLEVNGETIKLGASVGAVLSAAAGQGAGAMLRAADVAMYQAKRSGKGQVCLAPAEESA